MSSLLRDPTATCIVWRSNVSCGLTNGTIRGEARFALVLSASQMFVLYSSGDLRTHNNRVERRMERGLKSGERGGKGFQRECCISNVGGRTERFLTSDFQLLKIHVDKKAT